MKLITSNQCNCFESINEIYEKFNCVPPQIHYENCIYNYQRTLFEGKTAKIVYRCETERHNLVISTIGSVVVKVDGIYSIGKVAV